MSVTIIGRNLMDTQRLWLYDFGIEVASCKVLMRSVQLCPTSIQVIKEEWRICQIVARRVPGT